MNCNVPKKEKDCPNYDEKIYCNCAHSWSKDVKRCSHRKQCISHAKAMRKAKEAKTPEKACLILMDWWEKEKK